ncbi:MAG: DUF6431 domain-containing protein [Terriglobia bacterium]
MPPSTVRCKQDGDWTAGCDQLVLRRCPVCDSDSIVGHGRRSKQAHDEHHDRIHIRQGRCPYCKKTFTFLPCLLLPYTHYSLEARSQALQRRFEQHRSWEDSAPKLKDANRLPEPSTLRRWARGLNPAQPAASFLQQTLARVAHWLSPARDSATSQAVSSWLIPAVRVLWPLRR